MIDLETIKKQNNLITNEEGKIIVKPLDRHNFVTFPIENLLGALLLTLEEYLGLRANYYRFNETLTGLELNERDDTV